MTDPYDVAERILAAVVTAFADTTHSQAVVLPKVQYVPEGRMAPADGPQLTVAFVNLTRGMPGQPDGPPSRPEKWTGTFEVELLRTRGAGLKNSAGRQSALPTAQKAGAAGVVAAKDFTKMLEALQAAVNGNSITNHWQKIALGPIEPVGPDGDLIGVKATVGVLLL